MRFGDCATNRKIGKKLDPILNGILKDFTTKECQMINTDKDIMSIPTNVEWDDTNWIVSSTGKDKKTVPWGDVYYRYTEVEYSDEKIKRCRSNPNIPSWYWLLNPNTRWDY